MTITERPTADADLVRRTAGAVPRPGRGLRPCQHVLPRGLRGAGRRSATWPPRSPPTRWLGLSLGELGQLQRRLAQYAPSTALATSMHFYWVGMAAELHRLGDRPRLDPARRGSRSRLRGRTRRGRQRRPGGAVDGARRAGRGRLQVLRPQALRLAEPGVDPVRRPRAGRVRPGQPGHRPGLRRP